MAFNDLDNAGGGSTPTVQEKAYFEVKSADTIPVSTDPNNPSFFTNISLVKARDFEISDAATGAVRNISGRTIEAMTGTVSYVPDNTGGGTNTFYLFSERSADGITWTVNADSLRPVEINNTSESFGTKVSSVVDLEAGHYLRFRMYLSAGTVSFTPTSTTVLGGQTVDGPSVFWELSER